MNRFTFNRAFWLSFAFVICVFSTGFVPEVQSQKPPLMQDIRIQRPRTTPTPFVNKTGRSKPTANSKMASRRTRFPVLADVAIPGYSGIVVESENGATVMASYSAHTFNPASNVKVATGYAVLKTFGVNFRFATNIWTDGSIDRSTGTIQGNLYVSGRDPVFNYEHAVAVANELNKSGIRRVEGDLIVTNNFVMNFSGSSRASANSFKKTMNGGTRSRAANKAWNAYLANSGKYRTNITPSVLITGDTYVEGLPSNVRILFAHESAPLKEIVKATLSYSNNFLSHRLGDMLGGAYGVARIVQRDARVPASEFKLATCSGLGVNRVSPRAQIRLLKTFKHFLKRNRMDFSDVMPVAGLDEGTLRNRFKVGYALGSVVGKTGTLGRTDGGVSTLSGEITTAQGKFLFVIFNQRGGVRRFRSFQNSFVPLVQGVLGGARRMSYTPQKMGKRLAKSRIRFPRGSSIRGEEEDDE